MKTNSVGANVGTSRAQPCTWISNATADGGLLKSRNLNISGFLGVPMHKEVQGISLLPTSSILRRKQEETAEEDVLSIIGEKARKRGNDRLSDVPCSASVSLSCHIKVEHCFKLSFWGILGNCFYWLTAAAMDSFEKTVIFCTFPAISGVVSQMALSFCGFVLSPDRNTESQLVDRLSWTFVETFTVSREITQLMLNMPWLFLQCHQ